VMQRKKWEGEVVARANDNVVNATELLAGLQCYGVRNRLVIRERVIRGTDVPVEFRNCADSYASIR
jgi:hypothetical protein